MDFLRILCYDSSKDKERGVGRLDKRKRLGHALVRMLQSVSNDKVTVYAAQASFFTIISAVPFLSLLLSVFALLMPENPLGLLPDHGISPEMVSILGPILEDLQSAPQVSLLSFSAIVTLWSASKGTSALRAGLEIIYHADAPEGYLSQRLRSLGNTLVFIVLILCSVVLLLFGDLLDKLIPFVSISALLLRWRTPSLVLFICVVFTAMYTATGSRSHHIRTIHREALANLPGALFASMGWILFSRGYALYIRHFPSASAVYGSLGALCLIMLWLYFCMVILLLGAEVNKMLYRMRPAP